MIVFILLSLRILELNYERNIFPKILAIAEAAYSFIYNYERQEYERDLAACNRMMTTDKDGKLSLKMLKQFYRDHPIRRKVREFVLQGPAVLVNSYGRYEAAIRRFQQLDVSNWKYLNSLIQSPESKRVYEIRKKSRDLMPKQRRDKDG